MEREGAVCILQLQETAAGCILRFRSHFTGENGQLACAFAGKSGIGAVDHGELHAVGHMDRAAVACKVKDGIGCNVQGLARLQGNGRCVSRRREEKCQCAYKSCRKSHS